MIEEGFPRLVGLLEGISVMRRRFPLLRALQELRSELMFRRPPTMPRAGRDESQKAYA